MFRITSGTEAEPSLARLWALNWFIQLEKGFEMNTIEKLDQLAELQAQSDLLRLKKQELIDGILTPEIKTQISDVEAEFEPQEIAIREKSSELEKSVKDEVVELGQSVKGTALQAVFSKGRTKWNDTGLMQYLSVHPEIAYLRTVGNPSVSIRKVGK